MGKISVVRFPTSRIYAPEMIKSLKIAPVLIAAVLVMTGCQDGESKGGSSASQSPAALSCDKVLSTQAKEAMKRVAGISASTEAVFIGDVQRTADELVGQYDAGVNDPNADIDFCGAHRGSSGLASAFVRFSLPQEVPEEGKVASIFKEYSMGKAALAAAKVGVLYFECSSEKFGGGAGTAVLVRGEVRSSYEATESEAAAREDNLRIVYESSRALSGQLQCKSNSGLSADFKMPTEL